MRRLLLPEVFLGLQLFLRLCAMCITCHIGLPFSSADSSRRPAPDSYEHKAICTSQSGQTSDSPHSALSQDGTCIIQAQIPCGKIARLMRNLCMTTSAKTRPCSNARAGTPTPHLIWPGKPSPNSSPATQTHAPTPRRSSMPAGLSARSAPMTTTPTGMPLKSV